MYLIVIVNTQTLPFFPACAARTFGKVDYSNNQLLFGVCSVGAFCKRPYNIELFGQPQSLFS